MVAPAQPNHYAVLHLRVGASAAAVRHAYREQAKQHHPDKGGSSGDFQRLQEAYEVLSNPDMRATYDRHLHSAAERRQQKRRAAVRAAEHARRAARSREMMAVRLRKAQDALARLDRSIGKCNERAREHLPNGAARVPGYFCQSRMPCPPAGGRRNRKLRASACQADTHSASDASAAGHTSRRSSGGGNASIYAGVVGMDLGSPLPSASAHDVPVFTAARCSHYHRVHTCRGLRAEHLVVGPELRFILEGKTACRLCLSNIHGIDAPYGYGSSGGALAGWLQQRKQPEAPPQQ